MTFKEWLINYQGNDCMIRDIQEDSLHDTTFPDSDSYEVYHSYIKWDKRADKIILEFFEHAFNCYYLTVFGKLRTSDK